eukprot:1764204-Amphidinium_carterae.1
MLAVKEMDDFGYSAIRPSTDPFFQHASLDGFASGKNQQRSDDIVPFMPTFIEEMSLVRKTLMADSVANLRRLMPKTKPKQQSTTITTTATKLLGIHDICLQVCEV